MIDLEHFYIMTIVIMCIPDLLIKFMLYLMLLFFTENKSPVFVSLRNGNSL